MEIVIIYVIAGLGLAVSANRDQSLTRKALTVSTKIFRNMLPSLLGVVGLIGLILGCIPPETIANLLGPGSGLWGTLLAASIGAITFIPSIVSFPLVGSLLDAGASVMTGAAFLTTLTMVGVVTAPIEIEQLGKRFTILRNGLSLLAALIIAFGLEVIL